VIDGASPKGVEGQDDIASVARSRRSSASISLSRLLLSGLRSRRVRLRFTAGDQNAVKSSCRAKNLHRMANSVLSVCVSLWDKRKKLHSLRD
jgi:hypothetical protein